eukprot:TRINITY_DN43135_c0_g1_i1.p1 TRINITY_DN43135_c0_g1~~TRINITY_DN43135_c0_g1_i1.p1  ORF type:complete len:380 (+),score=124.72 TRINITY_DN43135_c0_g1_i1:517-1656(+)
MGVFGVSVRGCAVLLVVLAAVEAKWIPSGPWITPSDVCTQNYGLWLEEHTGIHEQGCLNELPDTAVPAASPPNPSASQCLRVCFNHFYPGAEPTTPPPGVPTDTPLPPSELPIGTLNVTAFVSQRAVNGTNCHCQMDPVSTKQKSDVCPVLVILLPTGCLYEDAQACTDAPADGCIYTLHGCCIDAAGYDWNIFTQLFPWWACGVAAVLLLLTSLLVWVVRSRVRAGGSAMSLGDELEDSNVEKLKDEYAALLKDLVKADEEGLESDRKAKKDLEEGGEVPVPDGSEPTEHTSLLRVGDESSDGQSGSCPVCLEDLQGAQCVRLKCGHRLRLGCMKQYIEHSLTRSKIPACPICRAKVMVPSLRDTAASRDMSTIVGGR